MKEKTADIDILEEKEKEAIKDLEEYLHWEELQGFSMLPRDKHIETLLNLVETLIAENKELKENNEYLKSQIPIDKIFYYSYKDFIPKSKVEELIKEIKKYVEAAEICIEEKIIIADSDSLNYGRKEAHRVDLKLLQSLLGKE